MAQVAPAGGTRHCALVVEPGTVLLPEALAGELGVARGDSMTLTIGRRDVVVRVLGVVPAGRRRCKPSRRSWPTSRRRKSCSATLGRINRIDLCADGGASARSRATPPAGAVLIPAETEDAAFRELTAAFRTNLTALGLLALVVGMFLIYGTMAFAILQRTQTLGILRTLGVSRARDPANDSLGDGRYRRRRDGARARARPRACDRPRRARAANDRRSVVRRGRRRRRAVAVDLRARRGARPRRDAARRGQAGARRRAHHAGRRAAPRRARAARARGSPARGLRRRCRCSRRAGSMLAFGPSELYAAFAALFGVLAAGALLTPLATVALMSALDRVLGRRAGIPVTLAVRGVSASLSRTGVATAALAVAVATVNGVGLMIASFRASLDDWLQTTLTADVYVSASERRHAAGRARGLGRAGRASRRRRAHADAHAHRADGARRGRDSRRASPARAAGAWSWSPATTAAALDALAERHGRRRVGAALVRQRAFASATSSSCRHRPALQRLPIVGRVPRLQHRRAGGRDGARSVSPRLARRRAHRRRPRPRP